MPPVSPRKMRSVFLEEGKMGQTASAGKNHNKADHLQIHREFYVDGGVISIKIRFSNNLQSLYNFYCFRLKFLSSAKIVF